MDPPAPPFQLQVPVRAGRLPGLDLLRGIAALCVVYFHVMSTFYESGGNPGKGYLAVDFFFMLSGYVMARTYEHRFAESYDTGRFLAARYRRLWPVMAVGTLIGAPILLIEADDMVRPSLTIVANLMLLPTIGWIALYPVNSAAWSIFAELAVNLLHGLLLWRLPSRLLVWLPMIFLPVLAASAMRAGNLDLGMTMGTIPTGLARALFAYSLGILLWRRWRDEPTLRVHPAVAVIAMPVAMLSAQALRLEAWILDMIFVALVCPLMIAGGLRWRRSGRVAFWLGALSFPLYAIHCPILNWAYGLGLSAPWGIALALVAAAYIARRTTQPPRPEAPLAIA